MNVSGEEGDGGENARIECSLEFTSIFLMNVGKNCECGLL